jgi:hypothetical protein
MSRESEWIQAEDALSMARGLTELAAATNTAITILARAILELDAGREGGQFGLQPETVWALRALAEVKK